MNPLARDPWPFSVLPSPPRRPVAGWFTWFGGYLLASFGLFPLGFCLAPLLFAGKIIAEFTPAASAAILGTSVLLSLLSLKLAVRTPHGLELIERGRRMRAWDALSLLERDRRTPVLYLRSFQDDDVDDPTPPVWAGLRQRYEHGLARVLGSLGPVISIGQPGEELPQIGTARLYVPNEDWQQAVTYFFTHAAAVVIMVGKSEGIWWEITEAVRLVPREKLLFFFPYVEDSQARRSLWRRYYLAYFRTFSPTTRPQRPRMEAERQQRYVLFRDRCQDLFSSKLPDSLGDAQFLDFTAEGAPRLLDTRRPSPWPALLRGKILFGNRMVIDLQRTLGPFIEKFRMSQAAPQR